MNSATTETNEIEAMWAAAGVMEEPARAKTLPASAPPVETVTVIAAPAVHAAEIVQTAPARGPSMRGTAAAAPYIRILESKLAHGMSRFGQVLESIFDEVPTDKIVRASAVRFLPRTNEGGVVIGIGDEAMAPTEWSLGQIAERVGVPSAYLRSLFAASKSDETNDNFWRRELGARILQEHYGREQGRILARSVRGSVRGWLSDRYRRLDSRPLVELLANVSKELGAVPYDATLTETRAAIKVVLPEILEPLPGEYMIAGVEWSNSDYGNGVHGVRAFALRVACTNGATTENLLKQIHLGGRLAEDLQLSERTYMLDQQTSASALNDMIRGALGPGHVERLTERLEAAHAKRMSDRELAVRVAKLPKKEAKAITDAYGSDDVINLPEGKTAWRASNAISWVARHTEEAERRLDLERMAGELLVPAAKKDAAA